VNTDAANLCGTWSITSLEVDGSKMSEGAFGGSQIVMDGGRFTTVSMGAAYGGTYDVDERSAPKRLDLTFTEGPHAGKKSLAIYALEGDSLKLCVGFAGRDRPAEFATAPGRGHVLETLARDRASAPGVPAVAGRSGEVPAAAPAAVVAMSGSDASGDMALLQGDWDMVSCVLGGSPLPAHVVSSGRRIVRGGEASVTVAGELVLNAALSLDPSAQPRALEYTLLAGPYSGQLQYGIYEIVDDTNRICMAPVGSPRPEYFASEPGDGRTLVVWKRSAAG
jgi:uncharacterized protein (TIGR03067 family)